MSNDPTSCLLDQLSREPCVVIVVMRQNQIPDFRYVYPKLGNRFPKLWETLGIGRVYQ
jgi:hypothetical protein